MSCPGSLRRAAPGFTLLELMLAIGILSLIMAMLATSVHLVGETRARAEGRIWTDREGRAVLLELSDEIRGAVFTPAAPSNTFLLGTATFSAQVPTNSISVSTLDPGHRRSLDGYGAEDVVTYSLAPNPASRGLFLLQRAQQSGLYPNIDNSRRVVIANNVRSLRFRYFDGNNWSDVWNSQDSSTQQPLPTAVAIDLRLMAPGGHEMDYSTQVVVPSSFLQW
ncbi:MAG TPA: type II secretion system protein GspJ [Candidatus Binataceae bacterium]|nr:type II secretion system protein GspJ [Candidatus Binataceae bacterium]